MRREYNHSGIVIPDGLVFWAPLDLEHGLLDLVSGKMAIIQQYGTVTWDASNGGYKVLSTANMHAPRILWSGLDLSFPNNSWRMEYDYIQSGTLVPVMFGHEDESGVGPSAVCSGQDQIGFNTSVWAHEINWLNAMHHRKVMIDNVIKRDDDTAYSGTQIYYYPENFTSTHKSYIGIGQHWFWSGRYCYVKNLKIFNTI